MNFDKVRDYPDVIVKQIEIDPKLKWFQKDEYYNEEDNIEIKRFFGTTGTIIQNAIDYLVENKLRTLRIEEGIYELDTPLIFKNVEDKIIYGIDDKTILVSKQSCMSLEKCNYITIKDLVFKNESENILNIKDCGLDFIKNYGIELDKCHFIGLTENAKGIYIENSIHIKFDTFNISNLAEGIYIKNCGIFDNEENYQFRTVPIVEDLPDPPEIDIVDVHDNRIPIPHQKTIIGVDLLPELEVEYNTARDDVKNLLPEKVKVFLTNYDEIELPVTWYLPTYNKLEEGLYKAVGTFELPPTINQRTPIVRQEVLVNVIVLQDLRKIKEKDLYYLDNKIPYSVELLNSRIININNFAIKIEESNFINIFRSEVSKIKGGPSLLLDKVKYSDFSNMNIHHSDGIGIQINENMYNQYDNIRSEFHELENILLEKSKQLSFNKIYANKSETSGMKLKLNETLIFNELTAKENKLNKFEMLTNCYFNSIDFGFSEENQFEKLNGIVMKKLIGLELKLKESNNISYEFSDMKLILETCNNISTEGSERIFFKEIYNMDTYEKSDYLTTDEISSSTNININH